MTHHFGHSGPPAQQLSWVDEARGCPLLPISCHQPHPAGSFGNHLVTCMELPISQRHSLGSALWPSALLHSKDTALCTCSSQIPSVHQVLLRPRARAPQRTKQRFCPGELGGLDRYGHTWGPAIVSPRVMNGMGGEQRGGRSAEWGPEVCRVNRVTRKGGLLEATSELRCRRKPRGGEGSPGGRNERAKALGRVWGIWGAVKEPV